MQSLIQNQINLPKKINITLYSRFYKRLLQILQK